MLEVGERCKVVSVHHSCFAGELAQVVVVAKARLAPHTGYSMDALASAGMIATRTTTRRVQ